MCIYRIAEIRLQVQAAGGAPLLWRRAGRARVAGRAAAF